MKHAIATRVAWLSGWQGALYRSLLICTLLFGLQGCATYSSSFGVIENNLIGKQYDVALKNLDKQKDDKKEHVLYLLNKGMIERMKRDFSASNATFEAAKREMDSLYAASVTENAMSVMVNDSTVSYSGDNYERVMLHLYMALNYLELNDPGSARVEVLQIDQDMRQFAEKSSENKKIEDAFALYLGAMIFEELGEWSDAMISYRNAYNVYKKYQSDYGMAMPNELKGDLLRMAKRNGLTDEYRKLKAEFGMDVPAGNAAEQGNLVFILNNGLAPIKREKAINSMDPKSGTMVRIALPYYESRKNAAMTARITINNQQSNTELVENIDAVAKKNLDFHMPAIIARSVARAVVKAAANKRAQELARQKSNNRDSDALLGMFGALAMQVATVATERADTRSWLTLPGNIQMADMALASGTYNVKVEILGAGMQVLATQEYPDIVVRKGHATFLTQHFVTN